MNWKHIEHKNETEFKRLTGFQRATFNIMVAEVKKYISEFCFDPNRCRPCKLCIEEQILATIMYWKEYSSMAYIGGIFGVHEATICRIIYKIENILSECKRFKLPDKKKLTKASVKNSFLIVDATEIHIERPKKNSKISTQAKKVITH